MRLIPTKAWIPLLSLRLILHMPSAAIFEMATVGAGFSRRASNLPSPRPSLLRRTSLTAFEPRTTTLEDRKSVTLTFTVEASLSLSFSLELLGDCPQLGNWSLSHSQKLHTDADKYPLWTSDPIEFECDSEELELEYKYAEVETSEKGKNYALESFQGNRRVKVVVKMTKTMEASVEDILHIPSTHELHSLHGYSLLYPLSACPDSQSKLLQSLSYLTHKNRDLSLKDFISVCFFLRKMSAEEVEPDRDEAEFCQNLLNLVKAMYRVMTDEVQPIVMKSIVYMSRCSQLFKEIMKGITNARLIHKRQLDLGCETDALSSLLDELFSSSPKDGMGMVRVLTLNSIRSVLKSLRCKSSKAELLLLYEVYITLLQKSYIETQFLRPDNGNIGNIIYQVAITAESAAISGVCQQEMRLAEGLAELESLEDVWKLLIQMIDSTVLWISRYVTAGSHLGRYDYLKLRNFLIDIGAESVESLLPMLFKALSTVSRAISRSFQLCLCPGKVTGKVVSLSDFSEAPSDFSSLIVLIPAEGALSGTIPKHVSGIVQVGDAYISAQLVAFCISHHIAFGAVSEESWEGVKGKVELRVEANKVCLF